MTGSLEQTDAVGQFLIAGVNVHWLTPAAELLVAEFLEGRRTESVWAKYATEAVNNFHPTATLARVAAEYGLDFGQSVAHTRTPVPGPSPDLTELVRDTLLKHIPYDTDAQLGTAALALLAQACDPDKLMLLALNDWWVSRRQEEPGPTFGDFLDAYSAAAGARP
jgi:hypothetical protein